jgi:succinate dehydrogenase flavin-adding protein (antitoxin of CptAB toxin-antitoxin module)
LKLKEFFSKNIEKNLKPQDVKELADSIGLSESKTYKWLWDHREQQERTQFKKIVKQLKKGEKIFNVTKVAH